MKRMTKLSKCGLGVLAVLALGLTAGIVTDNQFFSGDVVFDTPSNVKINGSWAINGTKVTATAANLNSGVASSTASLVSNAVLKVYGNTLTMTGTVSFANNALTTDEIAALAAYITNTMSQAGIQTTNVIYSGATANSTTTSVISTIVTRQVGGIKVVVSGL